jgi:predicted CXXCH cytochrome family protein
MRARAAVAGACALAAWSLACSGATRHKVLTFFFDGVPPPRAAETVAGVSSGASAAAGSPHEAPRDHGPYAARMCGACHEAQATNALVAPRDQICFRCHEIALDRKYVHGPIASGGCLVCHDPHGSGNRALLVSASDRFCFHCHDRDLVHRIDGHEGLEEGCTDCHDAHASDERSLLR